MPLRSVEAATRDDAIAAAREQFGPSARVVGVRRVRSGGVLGFFATERYVAEVAPDVTNRPAVPPAATQDDSPSDFSSPLASAAPARARAAAPARNGAAAWAAEAARTTETPAPARPSSPAVRPATAAARSSATSWQAAAPKRPADDDRVSELASLLASKQAEADTPSYARPTFPRATVARPAPERATSYPAAPVEDAMAPAPVGRAADRRIIPADAPDAPSPFTAALARMVAGDRDVRQAVEEALVRPGTPRDAAEPRPVRPWQHEESSVSSSPARLEEELVGDQVITASSGTTPTLEVPTWAAEPEVASSSISSREEAIAEVLRSALAQGHSDEALAGILRKVLAGASPQTALTLPDAAGTPQVVLEANVLQDVATARSAADVEVPVVATVLPEIAPSSTEVAAVDQQPAAEAVVPEAVTDEAAVPEDRFFETPAFEAPAFEPVFEAPSYEIDEFDLPVHEAPDTGAAMFEVPVFEPRPATPDVRPVDPFASVVPSWTATPAWVLSPATSMWGPPSMSATLWGEAAAPVVRPSAPIWGEGASPQPVAGSRSAESVEGALFEERVSPEPAAEATVETTDAAAADVHGADEISLDEVSADDVSVDDVLADDVLAEETLADEAPAEAVPADAVLEESFAAESVDEQPVEEQSVEELAPLLARTASDPAPMMSFDSTTVMPPLSLLPPLPGSRGRGRPPVPPSPSRRSASSTASTSPAPTAPPVESDVPSTDSASPASAADVWSPLAEPSADPSLATVTRLPVAPLMAAQQVLELPQRLFQPSGGQVAGERDPEPVATDAPATAPIATGAVADRLVELGVPRSLLGATFAEDVAERGTYAALTRALTVALPKAPEIPSGAGEVLFLVGPGVETLRAAQTLAASLRLDPDRVQWATRGDLAGLAPESSRVTTVGAAMNRRDEAAVAGTVTIVAVDAPMRADSYWTAQMLATWTPVAVWAVVEATRKPEDLEPWIARLPQVDAIVVQDSDLSADPAAVLRRVDAPVALIDGARATPHRWASLLCERLENPQT